MDEPRYRLTARGGRAWRYWVRQADWSSDTPLDWSIERQRQAYEDLQAVGRTPVDAADELKVGACLNTLEDLADHPRTVAELTASWGADAVQAVALLRERGMVEAILCASV